MIRRRDFRKFKVILDKYGIKQFYHFTDKANLESIIKNGGIYSWGECSKKGIHVPRPGGSELSHEIDLRQGLQEYVRVSICKRHPMMYSAVADGRMENPLVLAIDTDVLFIDGNVFSDRNATKTDSHKGGKFEDFESIHFLTALKESYFDVDDEERDFYQAEILVKHHIPLHYILNLPTVEKEIVIDYPINPYSIDISKEKPTAIIFLLNQSKPTCGKILFEGKEMTKSQRIAGLITEFIEELGKRQNGACKYEIAVVGYGDYSYSCFEGDLRYKNFVSIEEFNKQNPKSLLAKSEGNAFLHLGLTKVKRLIDSWISKHPNSYPPTVIHITEFGYNGASNYEVIQLANEIKSSNTSGGNTLFFNIIYTATEGETLAFPDCVTGLNNKFGEMYYLMSSHLPTAIQNKIPETNILRNPQTGLVVKADMIDIPSYLGLLIRD